MPMKPQEMIRLLKKNGFVELRTNGSHRLFRNPETGRTTTVPFHSKELKPGIERAILKEAGITKD